MGLLQITGDELLLVAGVIMLCAALAYAFSTDSLSSGCACAYLGVCALDSSGYIDVQSGALLFWAVAVLMVLAIRWMGGKQITVPRTCRYYIVIGSLAGMMVGVAAGGVLSKSTGAIAGAMLGALAFWRTSGGASFGHKRWQATLLETGLPAVVLTSQIGLALEALF